MISVKKDFADIPDGLKKEKPELDKSVITKLSGIYHDKCAYSEEKSTHASNFNIGVYRPISLYPWLANEWSNIFLICPECIASAGNRFPITGTQITAPPGDRMQWRSDSRTMLEEKPLLLNPEIDTPENHLYIDPNGIIYGRTERGRETIKVFNLNRDELISKRKKKVDTFLSKFKTILDTFAKLDWEKGNHYRDDKLIYDRLFKKIFA